MPSGKEMKQPRDILIGFYCTSGEAKKLKAAAKKEERTLSSYVRTRIFLPKSGEPLTRKPTQ
tara:strand:+ start:705 stop:890 length:186 start_codon:yes stop_codon:yes gene_type:complete